MLLTVKKNQRRLHQQIVSQFRGHRHFPVVISDFEASHGRQVCWTLRARNATAAIRERWAGASWIIELVSTGRRDGKPFHHLHFFITTLRTSAQALLRLVRQRWANCFAEAWRLRKPVALAPRHPAWGRCPSLSQPQWRSGVGLAAHFCPESVALQRFSLHSHWPDGRSARHQPTTRLGWCQRCRDGMRRLSVRPGLQVGDSESEPFWREFLGSLKQRGLSGVGLVISVGGAFPEGVAHVGLTKAVHLMFQGCSWQRCRVHFARNLLQTVPKTQQEMVAAALRSVFAQQGCTQGLLDVIPRRPNTPGSAHPDPPPRKKYVHFFGAGRRSGWRGASGLIYPSPPPPSPHHRLSIQLPIRRAGEMAVVPQQGELAANCLAALLEV